MYCVSVVVIKLTDPIVYGAAAVEPTWRIAPEEPVPARTTGVTDVGATFQVDVEILVVVSSSVGVLYIGWGKVKLIEQ